MLRRIGRLRAGGTRQAVDPVPRDGHHGMRVERGHHEAMSAEHFVEETLFSLKNWLV